MYAVVNLQFNWSDTDQNKSSTTGLWFSVFHRDMVHARSIAERTKDAYEIIMSEERDLYRAVLSAFYILKCIITCWFTHFTTFKLNYLRTQFRCSQTVNGLFLSFVKFYVIKLKIQGVKI